MKPVPSQVSQVAAAERVTPKREARPRTATSLSARSTATKARIADGSFS